MGCRGTIEIWENGAAPKDEERPVVLYTHWGAKEMEDDLRDVLSRKKRWNDPSYLSRMIFSRMIRNDPDGETGYGIQTCNIGDAEAEIIVDCDRQEIIVKGWDENDTYTFDDFIDPDELNTKPHNPTGNKKNKLSKNNLVYLDNGQVDFKERKKNEWLDKN